MNILSILKDTMTISGLTMAVFLGILFVVQATEMLVSILYALFT